jgi:hypothetical protein
MKLYTSYFAKSRELQQKKIITVGIALMPPIWFKGISLFELAPTREMLNTAKKHGINDSYIVAYKNKLDKVYWKRVFNRINEMSMGNDVALLCFEKNVNECHRKILSDYIINKFNKNIEEYFNAKDLLLQKKDKIKKAENMQSKLF